MPALRGIVAAAVLAAATVLGLPTAPATAAACQDRGGVTVVVDFHQLGGRGLHQVCDADGGGKTAATLFAENDFPLTSVQRFPGAVCRVSGLPADEPCDDMPPPNRYWALFWADGSSSGWTYSSLGATALKVPAGGSVAFSWSDGGRANPGVGPAVHPEEPATPQAEPTAASGVEGSGKGDKKPGKGETRKPFPTPKPTVPPATPSPTAATTPTASASSTPGKPARTRSSTPSATPSATPVASPTEAPVTAAPIPSASPEGAGDPVTPTAAETDDGGVPGWLPPALIALLAAVAGAVAWARRRAA